MEISGEYTFDAPQDLVWKALQDPDVLSNAMPGGEGFAEVGENEYEGNLKIKVGPVQGKFKGNIQLMDIVEPESYKMKVDGKGTPGFVKASGSLKLTPQGDKTYMVYEGSAQVGGRIASVGQRLMDTSARSIIRQSLEGLNDYLRVQVVQQAAADTASTVAVEGDEADGEVVEKTAVPTPAVPDYKPPSQTSMAVNVAKDVATDIIPANYWPYLIGLVVVLIIILLVAIF